MVVDSRESVYIYSSAKIGCYDFNRTKPFKYLELNRCSKKKKNENKKRISVRILFGDKCFFGLSRLL